MASLMENLLTVLEQENTEYQRLEMLSQKKRQIIIVLSKDPKDLTITNMIAFLNKQPEEQEKLRHIQSRLRETLERMALINQQNELLLQQAMEMVEFDLTLFKSMRQAPVTANYDKHAYNTGDLLGSSGFDFQQ